MTCKHKWHVQPARTYTSGGCCQTNYRHRDSFCLTRWVIAGCIGLWLCTWTSGVGVEESTTEAAKYEMRQRYVACAAAGRVRRCGEEGATVRRRGRGGEVKGRGGEVKGRGGEVKAFVTPTHIRPNLILIQPHHFSSRQLVRQPSTRQQHTSKATRCRPLSIASSRGCARRARQRYRRQSPSPTPSPRSFSTSHPATPTRPSPRQVCLSARLTSSSADPQRASRSARHGNLLQYSKARLSGYTFTSLGPPTASPKTATSASTTCSD
jgi:hypothetical protein